MNVGQILETHLGWACRGLGRVIDEALQKFHESGQAKALREHDDARSTARPRSRPTHEGRRTRRRSAEKLKTGVPIATPVFDGARESRHRRDAEDGGLRQLRSGHAVRRPHGRAVRSQGHRRLQVRAEAAPPRRRQDPRPLDRSLLASSPSSRWAARRSSAASASAKWKCGRSKPTARPTRCRKC